jgi:hypothetical protein
MMMIVMVILMNDDNNDDFDGDYGYKNNAPYRPVKKAMISIIIEIQ